MPLTAKCLEGVVAAETKLSFIDGEKGVLEYVGIPIGELAENSTFEETVFLLWNGRLPTPAELADFNEQIRDRYELPAGMEQRLLSLPRDAKPMHMIRTMVSALSMHDTNPDANDQAGLRRRALNILGHVPTLLAFFHRYRMGLPLVKPDRSLSIAANFLYMLNGRKPTDTMARAMDICLILHADHGLNNSTFSARCVMSTESDMYSAITAAIGSLKGPLHGGANEGVMVMLNEIPAVADCEKYIQTKLEKKAKIPGFGHRIYKSYDPRATHLQVLAKKLAQDTGNMPLYEKSKAIEEVMLREKAAKGIYPNVDFFSATTYHCIGLPLDLFTPTFVIARVGGWAGHVLEQMASNRLFRPDVDYTGPRDVRYTPATKR